MAINPIASAQSGIANMGQATRQDTSAKDKSGLLNEVETPATVFERSQTTDQTAYKTYNRGVLTAGNVPGKEAAKYSGLSRLIESLFGLQAAQGGKSRVSGRTLEQFDGKLKDYISGLQVDDVTRAEAQQAITEGGYWGVAQTSQRIVQFAISLSGGDTSKLETLKKAILKGYEEAERTWGTSLPDICRQTKEAALKGLDEWANG